MHNPMSIWDRRELRQPVGYIDTQLGDDHPGCAAGADGVVIPEPTGMTTPGCAAGADGVVIPGPGEFGVQNDPSEEPYKDQVK